jgi:hypothetical protein
MRPLHAVAAVLAVLVLAYWGWRLFWGRSGTLPPEVLAERALWDETEEEREKAAVELAGTGDAGIAELRRVLRESHDWAVRASCVQALGDLHDYESMDLLIQALGDETTLVRARAEQAISRLLRRDLRFPVQGPAPERARALAAIRERWDYICAHALLEHIKAGKPLAYFFDRNTKQLFEGAADADGLIETPSGPYRGRPAGAQASVFSCGDCGDAAQRFVGYLIVSEKAARKYGEKIVGSPPRDEAESAGLVVISRPGDDYWVYLQSPEGERITAEAAKRCGSKGPPVPCLPGW